MQGQRTAGGVPVERARFLDGDPRKAGTPRSATVPSFDPEGIRARRDRRRVRSGRRTRLGLPRSQVAIGAAIVNARSAILSRSTGCAQTALLASIVDNRYNEHRYVKVEAEPLAGGGISDPDVVG